MASIRVADFSPKVNGFHFRNAFPPNPIRQFRLGTIATLNIGDAANGLCGGMSFAVRDLYEHQHTLPPPDQAPPPGGTPRFDYIVQRQIDSFETGIVPLRFFKLMDPTRPATEPLWAELLGRVGIDRHSRTWVMIKVEWPAIQADLDGGQLSPIGLVKVIGRDPNTLGQNHQVLAYGYDLAGTTVTLRIYDPNYPDDEDVTLTFDTADPKGTVVPVWSQPGESVFCIFRAPYATRDPVPFR
jgi:hypothetical protein